MWLVTGDVLASVNVVLVSLGSCSGVLRGMSMTTIPSELRPRAHANVVIVALDNHLVSTSMPIVVPMSMVVVVMVVTRVGHWGSSIDVDIVVVSFDNHNVVSVLRAVVMIVVMVVVVVVMSWIWEGGWRTTVKGDVAVCPIDMNVRTRPTFYLCRLLCCCRREWTVMRTLRFLMLRISPRQKWWQVFGSERTAMRGEKVARALSLDNRTKRSQLPDYNETENISDGHVTFKPPLESFPSLSWICLPEADVRRAGRGMVG